MDYFAQNTRFFFSRCVKAFLLQKNITLKYIFEYMFWYLSDLELDNAPSRPKMGGGGHPEALSLSDLEMSQLPKNKQPNLQ